MERLTRQRIAIHRVLREARRPLKGHEVYAAARRYVPNIGTATVYRNLRAMIAEGLAVAVQLPGEQVRYEPAGRSHHHHFQCRTCRVVFELDGCTGGFAKLTPPGFRLEAHEVVLYGRCQTCATVAT